MAAATHIYPYGIGVGDSILSKKSTDDAGVFQINTSFVLFGNSFDNMIVRKFE